MMTFLIGAMLAASLDSATFLVTPGGKDSGSETTFRTVSAAQAAARKYHDLHPGKPATIRLHAGTYYLPATLQFDKRDSDTTYIGEGVVTLSGGEPITGWKHIEANRYETALPDGPNGKPSFGQLFVGNARRYRPRLPRQGYFKIAVAGQVREAEGSLPKGYDRFGFTPNDIRADWHDLTHVELLPFGTWEMSRFPIASVDAKTNTVVFAGRTVGDAEYTDFGAGKRYLVENVREALSEPGQWYLDREAGVLTYLARPGEDPRKKTVIAPRLESLVEIRGATQLAFQHIAFAHTAYNLPKTGRSTWQAESDISAAITVADSEHVTFDRCTLTHTGGYGIAFVEGSKHCALTGSILADLGAGGVKIGDGNSEATSDNRVADCRIIGGGRLHPAGVGVWIVKSARNRIEHNEIGDFYYSGISIGWNWGYGTDAARENYVAGNHIHTIGQGVLSDMGGIYTLGGTDKTVLENNRIHDITAFSYGGWGIYFDEGSTDVVARNNVVYRFTDAPFHQHYGKNNLVDNNILAFGRDAQMRRTRAEDHLSFTATHNLVLYDAETLLGGNWSGTQANFKLDNNLYWRIGAKPVIFPDGRTLAAWQAAGQDAHSLVTNPLFVNFEKDDFRLQSASPVAKIGFTPWDQGNVGPRKNALTDLPVPGITAGFPTPQPR